MRQILIEQAKPEDRDAIYRIRHEVYARELRQHPVNDSARLSDAIDLYNEYIVARVGAEIVGFISITPPGNALYSFEKYIRRVECPFEFDRSLFEVRLLTVIPAYRGSCAAVLLMWAAFRTVQEQGGTHIVAIGREEVLPLYLRCGLKPQRRRIRCGEVTFELLQARIEDTAQRSTHLMSRLRLDRHVDWRLLYPFTPAERCLHGGLFFEAIGEQFDNLERRREIINADVLDAWFPPAPSVVNALQSHLPWITATSPPTQASGLIEAITESRGVPADSILPGAGSSALIFLAFREWFRPDSRALVVDPTYGEYAHVLENIVGSRVDRFPLHRSDGFRLDIKRWLKYAARGYDLIVLANPNNPTGCVVSREELEAALSRVPKQTIVWLDEAYVEYANTEESLERFASRSQNVVVCKSMSKVYALSGLRVGYLCGPSSVLLPLRRLTPPWAVSLPAQVAAVSALQESDYYARRYAETRDLRGRMLKDFESIGLREASSSTINATLCDLPRNGPDASRVVQGCRSEGLFIRDGGTISPRLGSRTLRIAIKDAATNERMANILRAACR